MLHHVLGCTEMTLDAFFRADAGLFLMRHHFLLQQSLLPNSMKSQGVKRALESHSAAHPEAEEHLRNAYLQMGLGWIGPNEKRFIIPASSADMPQLPDRCTWRLWDCCAQRSSKCLYSACEGPTITPQMISLPLLERIHPKSYLSDIQTTKHSSTYLKSTRQKNWNCHQMTIVVLGFSIRFDVSLGEQCWELRWPLLEDPVSLSMPACIMPAPRCTEEVTFCAMFLSPGTFFESNLFFSKSILRPLVCSM